MRGRFVYGVVALLVLAALYACWCGAPLIWDGAPQLNITLIQQEPYVYGTRFHTLILWQPLVLVSRYTSNPTAIYMAYGLPFLLAPAVGVLVSWWVLRRESPGLILWVIFGVAIGPLPGQIFVINDSIFQQHLFWPLFASLFARLNWRQWAVLAALAVFQFAHPIGSVLFFGLAAAALVLAVFAKQRRLSLLIRAGVAMLLCAAAVWKIAQYPDSYAEREFTLVAARNCWQGGVRAYPIAGLSFMWAAGVLIFAGNQVRFRRQAVSDRLAGLCFQLGFACVLAGASIWIYWAASPHRWPWASEYRRWVVPLTAPFYVLCWLDYLLRLRRCEMEPSAQSRDFPGVPLHGVFSICLACVFVTVLGIQSTIFAGMTARLLKDMRGCPAAIVPDATVAWTKSTPLQHWSLTDLAIAVQGKHPRQLLVNPTWVRLLYGLDGSPPVFPNYSVYPHPPSPNTNGWYDMRPIIQRLPPAPLF